jgi:hypothetical protein
MACSSCKARRNNQVLLTQTVQSQPEQSCLYSFESLTNRLEQELAKESPNLTNTFYLRSAINFYSKNCNKFNEQLSAILNS